MTPGPPDRRPSERARNRVRTRAGRRTRSATSGQLPRLRQRFRVRDCDPQTGEPAGPDADGQADRAFGVRARARAMRLGDAAQDRFRARRSRLASRARGDRLRRARPRRKTRRALRRWQERSRGLRTVDACAARLRRPRSRFRIAARGTRCRRVAPPLDEHDRVVGVERLFKPELGASREGSSMRNKSMWSIGGSPS